MGRRAMKDSPGACQRRCRIAQVPLELNPLLLAPVRCSSGPSGLHSPTGLGAAYYNEKYGIPAPTATESLAADVFPQSPRVQAKVGRLPNAARFQSFRDLIRTLPEPCPGNPSETSLEALALHRSLCGPRGLACLGVISSGSEREINSAEFVATGDGSPV